LRASGDCGRGAPTNRRSPDKRSQQVLSESADGFQIELVVGALVRDGMVTRTPHATVPPRVDYELTELGRTLLVPLRALDAWANAHRNDIIAARKHHNRAKPGHHLRRSWLQTTLPTSI
jgi:hypothetical protein